jgi:hypothetical protein
MKIFFAKIDRIFEITHRGRGKGAKERKGKRLQATRNKQQADMTRRGERTQRTRHKEQDTRNKVAKLQCTIV